MPERRNGIENYDYTLTFCGTDLDPNRVTRPFIYPLSEYSIHIMKSLLDSPDSTIIIGSKDICDVVEEIKWNIDDRSRLNKYFENFKLLGNLKEIFTDRVAHIVYSYAWYFTRF